MRITPIGKKKVDARTEDRTKRSLTSKNLLEKKPNKWVTIANEILAKVIGRAELKGCWLIYGSEKNGKTWFSIMLAIALSVYQKVAYVSAEEGTDNSFQEAANRAGVNKTTKIYWDDYMPIETLIAKYNKPRSPNVIFIDNLTIYADEFKNIKILQFIQAFPNKLLICIAHEERKEAYPACARMVKKMAKVIIHVQGLKAFVVSRFSKGGEIIIDEEKAEMYWGGKA
jgi:KaiC/GvpD/RAD55 family RecA-like ATPase